MNTTASGVPKRILSALALIALSGAVVARVLTPPAPRPISAPETEFSADRAMSHVRAIAQRPHPIGSDELTRVRAFLLGELAALRLAPDSQDVTAVGTRYQALGHVRNIVARLPGTSPNGSAIMLMSHYDGVPAGPAASDAGSGVSVILEVVRALARIGRRQLRIQRSVRTRTGPARGCPHMRRLGIPATLDAHDRVAPWRDAGVGGARVLAVVHVARSELPPAWPLPLVILSALSRNESSVVNVSALWAATCVAVAVVAAVTAMICVVMIGIIGPGSVAMGALVGLLCCLLLPHFELLAGARRTRLAWGVMAASVLILVYVRATVRVSALHPERSALVYAIDADSAEKSAWLVTPEEFLLASTWASRALDVASTIRATGDTAQSDTLPERLEDRNELAHSRVPRVVIGGPTATVLSDSLTPQGRRLVFRVVTPHGALNTTVHAVDVTVLAAFVDGRAVDTTRYRERLPKWTVQFAAPPDSGFVLALTIPRGAIPHFDVLAEFAGLPALPGITIPKRPDDTVPSQSGDVTVVHRRVAF